MKNDNKKLSLPPLTNRGVVNTIKSDVFLLFDWVEATIFPNNVFTNIYDIFFHLFKVNRLEVLFDELSPHFGYSHCYSYRNLCIYVSDREDMGYHIYLTGTGCRDFEDLGLSYIDLFSNLLQFSCHFTRIDVSFDDFTGKCFPLNKIKSCIHNQEVVTKFRSSIQFVKDDLISNDNIGHTIWFGSRASELQFVFYDKLKERIYNANCEVNDDVEYWNRLEMRFRNTYADTIILNYLWCSDFNTYILGIINNYISFKVKSDTDNKRSRWKDQKWWSNFINDVPKIQFQNKPIEYNISKKRSWLDRSCSYSAFAVLIADIKDFSVDQVFSRFLYEFFSKGSKNISEYELQLINQYRIKNNLLPITFDEVKDFIKDIKEIIIKK